MRLIETTTDIRAPAARIWSILTDFPAYPAWNPFITAAEGELVLERGSRSRSLRPGIDQ